MYNLLQEKDSNLRPPAYDAGKLTNCSILRKTFKYVYLNEL